MNKKIDMIIRIILLVMALLEIYLIVIKSEFTILFTAILLLSITIYAFIKNKKSE